VELVLDQGEKDRDLFLVVLNSNYVAYEHIT